MDDPQYNSSYSEYYGSIPGNMYLKINQTNTTSFVTIANQSLEYVEPTVLIITCIIIRDWGLQNVEPEHFFFQKLFAKCCDSTTT